MKKTLLITTALLSFSTNVFASDISQYVSGKIKYIDMRNDARNIWTENGDSGVVKLNADDNVFGGSFAYGLKKDAFRSEIELNLQTKSESKTEFDFGVIAKVDTKIHANSLMATF